MLFDAHVQVGEMETTEVDGHLQVALGLILALPMPGGATMPLPTGVIRFGISKETAIAKFTEALAIAEGIKEPPAEKPSDIIIASSLEGVEKVVEIDKNLKKG